MWESDLQTILETVYLYFAIDDMMIEMKYCLRTVAYVILSPC